LCEKALLQEFLDLAPKEESKTKVQYNQVVTSSSFWILLFNLS